jgi:putative flippase GtrA
MRQSKVGRVERTISLRSAASFAIVGAGATGVQYVLMTLLIWLFDWPLVLASAVGFAVSACFSYCLNFTLTFRSRERHVKAVPRFIITAIFGLAINSLLLSLFTSLGLHPVPAQILSTLGVLLWNYTINSLWTFRNRTA